MIKDTKSTKEEYKYKATVRYNAIFILQANFRRLNPFNKKKKKKIIKNGDKDKQEEIMLAF